MWSGDHVLSDECERIQELRADKLIELGRLQDKMDKLPAGWPKEAALRAANLNAELNRLRDQWRALDCGSQV
jgi:hypothetical protein